MPKIFQGVEVQSYINDRLPVPADLLADTAYVNDISAETVQFYYYDNNNVLTIDAGEAAGTIVVAKLKYTGILDSLGAYTGNNKDTSLSFITNTTLINTQRKSFPVDKLADINKPLLQTIANEVAQDFSNGDFTMHHRSGFIIGKKADAGTSDTANYKVMTQTTGGGTSIASSIDLAKVLGSTLSATNPVLTSEPATAASNVAPSAFRNAVDETTALAVKASAGNVYGWNLYNPNAYDVFVKFYNTAAGGVTVGTTAVVETIQVPTLGSVVMKQDKPIKSFSTAISIAATHLVADNDTTAIAEDVYAHVYYK